MCALILAGCSGERKYRLAVSQCSSDDWRTKMNEEILREVMLHDDVEVEIVSADDSSEKQIADLRRFVDEGFDAIIVAPNEAAPLTPVIREIYESGTPVILFDRNIDGDSFTAFQGADNEAIGRMAALLAASLVKEPRVLEIKGLAGSSPAELRSAGFHAEADSLGWQVIAHARGNWSYEGAAPMAVTLLRDHPEANIFYCHNDRMAIAAADAARAAGRHDIKIIGIDAAPSIGIKAVAEGTIDATFLYPTDGHRLIRTALAVLRGEPFERITLLPTPAPVDASNAPILLLQDNALREETRKIGLLQQRMDSYSKRFSMQSAALCATAAALVLCAVVIFLLMRSYWSARRHRLQMEARNRELAESRDELDSLYKRLQEATGSKLTFFTNVSHDLRTPLTLIADPVAQIARADNLTPRQQTLMQLADKNVKRLQRLINQILDIRKYDNGVLSLQLANVDLSEAMREWTAPFAEAAAKRHIKFCAEVQRTPPIVTAIDAEKTERILFNLLSNAFKFTLPGGSIKVCLHSDGTEAVITVADTGAGIPADEINHIFERFFKTDRINPNGSGIGLALSKVFIDMQGGAISVESVTGKGSTFTVRLPIRLVQEEAPLPLQPVASSEVDELAPVEDSSEDPETLPDAPTILIIDDNPDICALVRCSLADHYTVLTALSGAQGVKLATRCLPDLVICDVMMPGMDGYTLCRTLKSEPLTSHIPVLLLTACSRDEQRTEGYRCGADAYMAKPFDSAMLLERCRALIANRRLVMEHTDSPAITPPSAPRADEFIDRFIALVESRMADSELSVEGIADELGLSRVQLYRKVKALTNYSAAEMVRNLRLKRAATMLKTSATTVAEVAYAVGFSAPGYFSRCYKEYFGETPAETQARTSKVR